VVTRAQALPFTGRAFCMRGTLRRMSDSAVSERLFSFTEKEREK